MRVLFGVLLAGFLLGLFAVGWSALKVLERRMDASVEAGERAEPAREDRKEPVNRWLQATN
jgi:hypothetical protein